MRKRIKDQKERRMNSLFKTAQACAFLCLLTIACQAQNHLIGLNHRVKALMERLPPPIYKPQKLRALVTVCINRTPKADAGLSRTATDALCIELARSRKEQFDIISQQEVWTAARRLNLPVPEETAPTGYWTEEEKFRLGNELNADVMFDCAVGVTIRTKHAKIQQIGIVLQIRDIACRIPLSGGSSVEAGKSLHDAIASCVEDVIRQCVQRLTPSGRVLSRRGKMVVLDRGVRDGFNVGDRCIILREVEGKKVKVSEVRVARSLPSHSEGDVVTETDEINAGDIVLVYYSPHLCIYFVPKTES